MNYKTLTATGPNVFIEMILPGFAFQRMIWQRQSPNPSECEGVVVAAGPKCKVLKVGDRVIYGRQGAVRELETDSAQKRVEIVPEKDVLCKIE